MTLNFFVEAFRGTPGGTRLSGSGPPRSEYGKVA